jgi:hypothetical protein
LALSCRERRLAMESSPCPIPPNRISLFRWDNHYRSVGPHGYAINTSAIRIRWDSPWRGTSQSMARAPGGATVRDSRFGAEKAIGVGAHRTDLQTIRRQSKRTARNLRHLGEPRETGGALAANVGGLYPGASGALAIGGYPTRSPAEAWRSLLRTCSQAYGTPTAWRS